ncbi:MAG TPA: hypothetical protein VG942_02515 [Hyphomonadaceae bacterium]|nr:hypothetical protein [Hyphomonadaceae bacterium]
MSRLLFAAPLILLGLASSGCVSNPTQELSLEAVCKQHFENDPIGYNTCMQSASNHGSAADVDPHQLPLRTGQPSD